MKFEPLVSIVIPVFNGENYLAEAIESALAQTYDKIEIIVVNDGSLDDGATERVATSFGDKIRYFSKVNGGTSTALNLGIQNMKGDYFCWLSHDDLYDPTCVEKQIEALARVENKKTITRTNLRAMNADYSITVANTSYEDHMNSWPLRTKSSIYPVLFMKLHGCQLMFHKSVFDEVGLFDESMLVAQDYEFFGRAFSKYPTLLVPEVLGTSRDSANRQGRRSVERGAKEYSEVFLNILDRIPEEDLPMLANNKLDLLKELQSIWGWAGYKPAQEEIARRLFPHLHINYADLPGKRFNGYDLHVSMRDIGFDASQIVWAKTSKSKSVAGLRDIPGNEAIYDQVVSMEGTFNRTATFSPFMDDILHHPLFIGSSLIHLHILHHPAFNINVVPLISELKPTVWSIHDPWILSGHCIHHRDCNSWEEHCKDCPLLEIPNAITHDNTALQFYMKSNVIKNTNAHFVVSSEWMNKKLQSSPMFKGKSVTKIPFGINQDVFKPGDPLRGRKKLRISSTEVVLFARADSAFKGTKFLVNAANEVAKKFPVVLVTVGEVGSVVGLNKGIRLVELGWVDDDFDLVDLYRACDLFLMPSEYESFGLMAAEAMSCGKVVVALDSRNSALPDTIHSPSAGLAAKPTEYAASVSRLIEDKSLRLDRETKSLAFAQEEYSMEKYTARMLKLYQQALEEFEETDASRLILQQLEQHSKTYRATRKLDNLSATASAVQGVSSVVWAVFRQFGFVGLVREILRFAKRGRRFLQQNGLRITIREFNRWLKRAF